MLRVKMWKQLGLQTCNEPASTIENGKAGICILLKGDSGDEITAPKPDATIYDICYRTPAKDVAPPPGVRVADLDNIKISLLLSRKQKKPKKRGTKRRKTDSIDMFEDSDGDDMLFSSQGTDQVTESDAILAMVDAALRLSISGDAPRMNSLADGLSAKFLGVPTSIASLAPAVFSQRALEVEKSSEKSIHNTYIEHSSCQRVLHCCRQWFMLSQLPCSPT
jgi:hypothetical protein